MKKDVDGINDEYIEYVSPPLLNTSVVEKKVDEPLENTLNLSEGEFDLFEKKNEIEESNDYAFDISQGKFDVFTLSKREDLETEESFDIISKDEILEQFPLVSVAESDSKNNFGESGDFILKKTPAKANSKNRVGIITAISTCCILIIFLLWTLLGILYTNNYNEYLYEEYRHGIDVKYINPDFVFFVTIGEKSLPVIESDSPNYYKTVNGKFFSPGTLTTSDGSTVTGSSRLLPAFDSSLIGKTVTTESQLQKTEYEIYTIGEYTPQNSSEEFVIYIEDSSSSTGYTALFAKPSK